MDATFDVEVLAAGMHKGTVVTTADLEQVAGNFSRLREYIKPPVKLGHSRAQLLAGQRDGDPALGWVDALRVTGDKLVATLTNVPERLRDLIAKRRYRRVSAELALDFAATPWEQNIKTGVTGKVLTGLALLGADLPAVANLADLGTLLASDDAGATFAVETDATVQDFGEATVLDADVVQRIPRTVDDEPEPGSGGQGLMAENKDAERVAQLEAELKARDEKDAERDRQLADLTAKQTELTGRLELAAQREQAAIAKARTTEAERFVERYSGPDCLKLTSDASRGAVRALYLALSQAEEPIVAAEQAPVLHLATEPTALSGVAVLATLLDELPDAKALLTTTANPTAKGEDGKPADADEYDALLAATAKEHSLNLSIPTERAKAAELVLPRIKDNHRIALAPVGGVGA